MSQLHEVTTSEKWSWASKPIPVKKGQFYQVKCPIKGIFGKKFSSYLALILFNRKGNEIVRRIRWIDDFSGIEKVYEIIARAEGDTTYALINYVINSVECNITNVSLNLVDPNSISLNETTSTEESFDELYDFDLLWERTELEKNYWKIVGSNSESEYSSIAEVEFSFLKFYGLNTDSKILDIGCGTGRLPSKLFNFFSDKGVYFGLDITQKAIDFCKMKYDKPNFHFLYKEASSSIPLKNENFDFIVFFSVFTHIYPNEILNYLIQCKTLLDKNGKIIADIFTDDKVVDHTGDSGVMVYNVEFFKNLIEKSGLRFVSKKYGLGKTRPIFIISS